MSAAYELAFFDVDSTLVSIEGIDVLGQGHAEVAELTRAAMEGSVPLDEVYARRLEIIRPSRESVERLADEYKASLVAGAAELIDVLHDQGVNIYLVSAGIAQAIVPLAQKLGISISQVRAVALVFDESGQYLDFDRRSLLTRPRGKEIVVRDIRARAHGKAVFIGDGVSDLETKTAVDLFIGYGGVTVRDLVRHGADAYVTDPDLRSLIPTIIGSA
jgi:phosphoserine phosphatase